MLTEIHLPFPEQINKSETTSFYLSFLIRSLVIMGEESYETKITKKNYIESCQAMWLTKSQYLNTWNKWAKVWQFFKVVTNDYIVLNGKESVIWEKGFCTQVWVWEYLWYYKFQAFVTSMYALRPVKQDYNTLEEYRYAKKKKWAIREELLRRLDETKHGRWQRRIALQSGCCHKTANNRLNKLAKNEEISLTKRLSSYNGFRINLTNIYWKHWSKFIHFQTKKYFVCKGSIVNWRRIFLLDDCKKYLKWDDSVYEWYNCYRYK